MAATKGRGKNIIQILLCVSAAFILIFDSKSCAEAVTHGISICLQTIIPALFPLMVLTRWMMGTDIPRRVASIVGRIMVPLFSQPPSAAICFVLGIIGGYPIGAQTVSLAYEQGDISEEQAEHLLSFCNNAGPSFLFGIIGATLGGFPVAAALYAIHILSAILVGVLLKPHDKPQKVLHSPRITNKDQPKDILMPCIRSMALICTYILLFQIFIAFLEKYAESFLPHALRTALTGFLELSSGCLGLREIESVGWQYCLASGFLGFGGLCVWMQTRSVLSSSGLKGKYYLFGKLLHCAIAVLLTWSVIILFPGLLPLDTAALYLPNHEGLFQTTLWVFGISFLLFAIWCLILRKRAGKSEKYGV